MPGVRSEFPPERSVQHRRYQCVEFGGRFGLKDTELGDAGPHVVEIGDDPALLFQRRNRNFE